MIEKDEMGDLIINEPITIQKLYELACQEGIQDRILNIVVRRDKQSSIYTKPNTMRFGKWWTKKDAILNIEEHIFPDQGNVCQG